MAETDFGQSDFGHPYWPSWGPEMCGPEGWGPEGWGPEGWGAEPRKSGPRKGGAPKGGGAPKSGGPRRVGGPKFRAFLFPFPPPFRSFCVSLGVFSWNFGGVWKRRGRQMCTFGVLGLSCEAPAAPKPPQKDWNPPRSRRGFTPQPESPNVHI